MLLKLGCSRASVYQNTLIASLENLWQKQQSHLVLFARYFMLLKNMQYITF